jgi:hypothetical protein
VREDRCRAALHADVASHFEYREVQRGYRFAVLIGDEREP